MKKYEVIKIDVKTEKETNLGSGYTLDDVKQITKGYKFNGLFYERQGSKYMYIVNEKLKSL